jgi:hypothetical protein
MLSDLFPLSFGNIKNSARPICGGQRVRENSNAVSG